MGYTVAVVGATGAVGAQMIKMLEESILPIDKVRFLASARSAGKILKFKGQDIVLKLLLTALTLLFFLLVARLLQSMLLMQLRLGQ